MTVSYTNTIQEFSSQVATSADTWTTLASSPYATWDNWTQWNTSPRTVVGTETLDMGSTLLRTPLLTVSGSVVPTIEIKISTTGAFSGEETTITPTINGTHTYPSGRYYKFTATWAPDSQGTIPTVGSWLAICVREYVDEEFWDLNTATLGGTQDAREVSTTVAIVTDMRAMSETSEAYFTSGYVASSYIIDGEATYVSWVSKGTTPKIRVSDNQSTIDGIIDLTVRGLPAITQSAQGSITIK